MHISALTSPTPVASELALPTLAKAPEKDGPGFEEVLGNAIGAVREQTHAAEATNAEFATSTNGALHENMIALEKANVALKLMVSVRNKVVDSYKELMRTT
jgi:flagellar hook-basal body complex protein FliE